MKHSLNASGTFLVKHSAYIGCAVLPLYWKSKNSIINSSILHNIFLWLQHEWIYAFICAPGNIGSLIYIPWSVHGYLF